jgi:chaperonin cofactor prefoldin
MFAQSFVPTSDERLKENFEPLPHPLDTLKGLQGVSYNRIEDITKRREIGFVAQDVQEVAPEFVHYHEDTDVYGIAYDKMTALITEALKEEDEKVQAIDARVLTLEAKIATLETRLANLENI